MANTVTHIIPHLHFHGEATKAIELYQRALGAEVLACMRWSDMPGEARPSAEDNDKVMHAALQIGQAKLLLADRASGSPNVGAGNGTIMIECADADDLQHRFDALAEGGKVTMAIHDAFWGARFGILDDAFGVTWMFHSETKRPG